MRLGLVVLVVLAVPALASATDHKKSKHASDTSTTSTPSTKQPKKEGTVTRHVEYMDADDHPASTPHHMSRAEVEELKQEQLNRAAGHAPIREGWRVPVDKEPGWDQREKAKGYRTAPTDDFDDPHGGSVNMKTDMNGNQMETHF